MKHQSLFDSSLPGFLFFLALFTLPFAAIADDKTWLGGATGDETDFHTGANWDPSGVPGSADVVIFDANALEPDIELSADATTDRLDAREGSFELDLGGNSYTLLSTENNLPNSATAEKTFALMVAGNEGQVADLTITNGEFTTTHFLVGGSLGTDGTLTLSGADLQFTHTGGGFSSGILGGHSGTATLRVEARAQVQLNEVVMNRRQDNTSNLIVTGEDTLLRFTDRWHTLGVNSTATITVSDGAELDATDDVRYGRSSSTTTMVVDDATFKVGNRLNIAGDDATASITLQNGSTMELSQLQNLGEDDADGTLILTGESTGTIAGNWTRIGSNRGEGLLIVEEGSTLSFNGRIEGVGRGDGSSTDRATGTMIVRDQDSVVTLGSYVEVGLNQNADGLLEVYDHGEMNVGSYLWVALNEGATGMVSVRDSGTLTVSGTTRIGGDSSGAGGIGVLDIRNGGVFEGNGSVTTIWESGTLAIEAGLADLTDITFDSEPGAIFDVTLSTGHFASLVEADDVTLGAAELQLSLAQGFTAQIDDQFSLIDYDVLSGQFSGLNQGDIILIGLYEFQIDYGFGFSDQILLTTVAIPEPSLAGLGLLLLAGLGLRRRRHRSMIR